MRILLVSYYPPYPPSSGHPIRNYNLFRRIALEHEVWLLTFSEADLDSEHLRQLRTFFHDVQVVQADKCGALDRPTQALRYALSGTPPDLRSYYYADAAHRIARLVRDIGFDVVQIEDSFMAIYQSAIPKKKRPSTVLTLHDVVFDKLGRQYHLENKAGRRLRLWLHGRMMRRWEPRYLEHFDCCITMSSRDRDLLLAHNPRLRIEVVPNGVDTDALQPLAVSDGTPGLIFVGNMAYRPNVDAVTYFCNEVLPLIQASAGGVDVWIVGINPLPEVQRLDGNGVHVVGQVPDVRPWYQRSHVCVIPLRAGGGTRLKILESMALGRPVVSTTIGCEGINVADGQDILVADSPEEFAAKTVQLLSDQALWQGISRRAREMVVQSYDWGILAGRLMRVYDELAG